MRSHPLLVPVVVGIVARLVLAPFTSWATDDFVWFQVAASGAHHLNVYARPGFAYPPVWGDLLQLVGQLLGVLGASAGSLVSTPHVYAPLELWGWWPRSITGPLFNVSFKSVLFVFDGATAGLVYQMVSDATTDDRRARLAFAAVFCNPFVIMESAVMGGFDIIVAFCILAAIRCTLTRRYLLAGVTVAVGILLKVAPIYIVPLIAGAIIGQESLRAKETGHAARDATRALLLATAGGAGATLVVLLPEIVSGSLGVMWYSTFARGGASGGYGGLSLYGLAGLRGLGSVGPWLLSNRAVVNMATELVVLAVAVWAGMRVSKRPSVTTLSSGAVAIFLVVYLGGPVTEPQYLIWALPSLVVLRAVTGRHLLVVVTYSLGPIVYIFGLLGPLGILSPLASSHLLLTDAHLERSISPWLMSKAPGLWASLARDDVWVIGSVIAVVTFVALLVQVGRAGPGSSGEPSEEAAHRRSRPRNRFTTVLVAILAGAPVLLLVTLAGASPGSVSFQSGSLVGDTLGLRLAVRLPPGESSIDVAAFPIRRMPPVHVIDVYDDPSLPVTGTLAIAEYSLAQHIRADLAVRGSSVRVEVVNAAGVQQVFGNLASAPGTAVVDLAGVLPSSSFSKSVDLVRPWVAAGGVLVFGGAPVGWYIVRHGGTPNRSVLVARGAAGSRVLLPGNVFVKAPDPLQTAGTRTPFADALSIQYSGSASGIRLGGPNASHTVALGWSGGGVSSVTTSRAKLGAVVTFSGPTYLVGPIAEDLDAILLSRAYAALGPIAWHRFPASAVRGGELRVVMTVDSSSHWHRSPMSVVVLDPDRTGSLFQSFALRAPPPSGSLSLYVAAAGGRR